MEKLFATSSERYLKSLLFVICETLLQLCTVHPSFSFSLFSLMCNFILLWIKCQKQKSYNDILRKQGFLVHVSLYDVEVIVAFTYISVKNPTANAMLNLLWLLNTCCFFTIYYLMYDYFIMFFLHDVFFIILFRCSRLRDLVFHCVSILWSMRVL